MLTKTYYVYIMTSINGQVLYTGVTNDLIRREFEHKYKQNKNSFTCNYNIGKLVYYEIHNDVKQAILREKYIKGKSRSYKLNLIKEMNPNFKDLFEEILG